MDVFWSPRETWRAAFPLVICIAKHVQKNPRTSVHYNYIVLTFSWSFAARSNALKSSKIPFKTKKKNQNIIKHHQTSSNISFQEFSSITHHGNPRKSTQLTEARRALRTAPGQTLDAGPKSRSSTWAERWRLQWGVAGRAIGWWRHGETHGETHGKHKSDGKSMGKLVTFTGKMVPFYWENWWHSDEWNELRNLTKSDF